MCLSLRLRCLLLLNGGRQGDCVRVEFWLRETLLQRLLPLEGREREAAIGPDADVVRKLGRRGRCSPLHPWQFSAQHRRTQKAMHSMLFFVPNKWSYSVRRLWYLSRLLWIFSSNLDEQPHDFRFHSLRGSGL